MHPFLPIKLFLVNLRVTFLPHIILLLALHDLKHHKYTCGLWLNIQIIFFRIQLITHIIKLYHVILKTLKNNLPENNVGFEWVQ